jgi:hypothetical protein
LQPRKVLPVLILIILLMSCAIVWLCPPSGNYRVDNPAWNGYSELSKKTGALSLSTFSDLPSTGEGTALILVAYEQFTEQELTLLRNYVGSGGTLALLDDYGYGNQVLGGLELDAQFSGQTLLDPLFNYKNQWFPTTTDFAGTAANVNVSSIVFNHATYLNKTGRMNILANSSSFSFSDIDNDNIWDSGEPSGTLPVAAFTKYAQGYVVIVSDPSLGINSMLDLNDNFEFISKILSIESSNPQVYIDQSHLPITPLDQSKAILVIVYGVAASQLGTLSLIIVVLALSLKLFWKRGKYERN